MDDHMTDGILNVAALFSVLHRFGGPRGRARNNHPATLRDWWLLRADRGGLWVESPFLQTRKRYWFWIIDCLYCF